jgi:protease-4
VLALLLLLTWGGSALRSWVEESGGSTARASRSGRLLKEILVEDHQAADKLLIVDILGMISGEAQDMRGRSMVDGVADQLDLAAEDPRIKAVVLKIDSPGGEVLAADDTSRLIQEFQERSSKPVVAAMGGLAASGGYYIAAAARWIVAHELTLTGSIGVVMQNYNYRGLMDKVGVQPLVFKSGRFKDMLSPSRPPGEISPEERSMMQAIIDQTFARFKAVVQRGRERATSLNQGRGRSLEEGWEEHADGRIFSGKQAFDLGFVDELGSVETAVKRAQQLSGVERANLVRYQEPFEFGDLFRLLGVSQEGRGVRVDLGWDLPRLQSGRLYFLSPALCP